MVECCGRGTGGHRSLPDAGPVQGVVVRQRPRLNQEESKPRRSAQSAARRGWSGVPAWARRRSRCWGRARGGRRGLPCCRARARRHVFKRYSSGRHERGGRVAHLVRRPPPDPGALASLAEVPPQVRRVDRPTVARRCPPLASAACPSIACPGCGVDHLHALAYVEAEHGDRYELISDGKEAGTVLVRLNPNGAINPPDEVHLLCCACDWWTDRFAGWMGETPT